jgi:hypothetical protein
MLLKFGLQAYTINAAVVGITNVSLTLEQDLRQCRRSLAITPALSIRARELQFFENIIGEPLKATHSE